jgi:hypothetical protein
MTRGNPSALTAAFALSVLAMQAGISHAKELSVESLAERAAAQERQKIYNSKSPSERVKDYCDEVKRNLLDKLAEKGISGFSISLVERDEAGTVCDIYRYKGLPEERMVWPLSSLDLPLSKGEIYIGKLRMPFKERIETQVLNALSNDEINLLIQKNTPQPQ